MAETVIKKDGSREPFDGEKIRRAVSSAAKEGGLPEEQIRSVTNQVLSAVMRFTANKTEVSTSELKGKVLGELDELAPSVAEAWREYDKSRGRS